jgi:hypothetical protein
VGKSDARKYLKVHLSVQNYQNGPVPLGLSRPEVSLFIGFPTVVDAIRVR